MAQETLTSQRHVVLITGCSSGIGRASDALRFEAAPFGVAVGPETKRPKTRHTVTLPAKLASFTQVLPDKLLDVAQGRLLGQ